MPPGRSTNSRRRKRIRAAQIAKVYCARATRTVCETAVQVHGGIGNTWDCLVHVYLRRAPDIDGAVARNSEGDRPWTFVTPQPKPPSGSGCDPGFRCTPRSFPVSGDEYWARQAEWHQALYQDGLLRPVLAPRVRRAGAAAGIRRHPRRRTGPRGRSAAAQRGLSGPRHRQARPATNCGNASCPASSTAPSAGARVSASPAPVRTWRR